jgi:hypothetical protein
MRNWTACLTIFGGLLAGGLVTAACGAPPLPELENAVRLSDGPVWVEAGDEWTAEVKVPALAEKHAPVLFVRQRLDVPGAGGCNFVMQILVDGRAVTEHPFRPRLINKAPFFDPPETDYHFAWYRTADKAWMTVFGESFDTDWGGTGQDFDFLIDLSGLVAPGETARITFRHRLPLMPAWLKRSRAPLLLDPAMLGTLPLDDVAKRRKRVHGERQPRQAPVTAALPHDAVPAEPPYELSHAQRPEEPRAQVAFDNLAGWNAQVFGEGEVALSASVSKRLWRPQLADLSYIAPASLLTVFVTPPEPIPVGGPFDAANFWLYSDHDRMAEPHPHFTALLVDANGRDVQIDLGEARNSYWQLLHGVLDPRDAERIRFPARFTGLIADNLKAPETRHCYLESLAFYTQNRQPETRLLRPLKPVFPVGDDGLLPTPGDATRTTTREIPDGAEFTAESPQGTLVYRVVQGRCAVRWNDGEWFYPIDGAGVQTENGLLSNLDRTEFHDGTLTLHYEGTPKTTARIRLTGRTLVLDWQCNGPGAGGLAYGRVTGLPQAKSLIVPYLLFNHGGQAVACGKDVFVSLFPDVYHSDFSWVDAGGGLADDGTVALIDATKYEPLTDGTRNPLRERMLLTVSPRFADILPNVPNPPSPNRESLAPYAFVMASHPWPNLWRTTRRFGIQNLIVNDFAGFFVDAYPQGFAGRWQPHPSITVNQIQEYRRFIHSLGYRFGMYQDTREFFPLNQWWDEDKVALTSEGDFVEAWYGNLHTKPNHLAEMIRRAGKMVHQLYPPDHVYLDVHTNMGPKAVDYETHVPLAGMARGTIIGNGDAVVEARKWYGATVSEGIFRWLYAGLTDMDYAQINAAGGAQSVDLLPDFDLLKLHPLQHGTMMGWGPANFLTREEVTQLSQSPPLMPNPEFYKYVGTSIAHGHMLLLGYGYIPPLQLFIRYCALMQPAQTEYLTDTVAEILYHDGNRFLHTGDALRAAANKKGRLRVRYRRGLTVTVNLNPDTTWTVQQAGRVWELPPYGWVIDKPGKILSYSALRNGVRVDFAGNENMLYLGSGKAPGREGPLEVEGAVWLTRQEQGWKLFPCGNVGNWERVRAEGWPERMKDFKLTTPPKDRGCKTLIVDLGALPGAPKTITGLTTDGKEVEADTMPESDGRTRIRSSASVEAYRLQ